MASKHDDSSQRAGLVFHDVSEKDLKPGDHIYCYRIFFSYSHHGIYIGKEGCEVIHFAPPAAASDRKFTNQKSSARIRSCTLSEFCGTDTLRLVGYDQPLLLKHLKRRESSRCIESDPPDTVIARAEYYLNHPNKWDEYNLITNNCETFAFYCKTGLIDMNGQGNRLQGLGLDIIGSIAEDVVGAIQ